MCHGAASRSTFTAVVPLPLLTCEILWYPFRQDTYSQATVHLLSHPHASREDCIEAHSECWGLAARPHVVPLHDFLLASNGCASHQEHTERESGLTHCLEEYSRSQSFHFGTSECNLQASKQHAYDTSQCTL